MIPYSTAYDCSVLRFNPYTCKTFITVSENRFSASQDFAGSNSSNTTYNNVEVASNKSVAEFIPMKPNSKKFTPWEPE